MTAISVPIWLTAVNAAPGSRPSKNSCPTTSRWAPLEETEGTISPWTILRMIASSQLMRHRVPARTTPVAGCQDYRSSTGEGTPHTWFLDGQEWHSARRHTTSTFRSATGPREEFYSGLFGWQIAAPPGFETIRWQAPLRSRRGLRQHGFTQPRSMSRSTRSTTLEKVAASGRVVMAKPPISDTSWWATFGTTATRSGCTKASPTSATDLCGGYATGHPPGPHLRGVRG